MVIEVIAIAPKLYLATLFKSVGRQAIGHQPIYSLLRQAGGGSKKQAITNLRLNFDEEKEATVVSHACGKDVIWQRCLS